jgi:hypothetical protein
MLTYADVCHSHISQSFPHMLPYITYEHIYIHTYIYMCVCVCVCVCVCIYIHIYIYVYVYIYARTSLNHALAMLMYHQYEHATNTYLL